MSGISSRSVALSPRVVRRTKPPSLFRPQDARRSFESLVIQAITVTFLVIFIVMLGAVLPHCAGRARGRCRRAIALLRLLRGKRQIVKVVVLGLALQAAAVCRFGFRRLVVSRRAGMCKLPNNLSSRCDTYSQGCFAFFAAPCQNPSALLSRAKGTSARNTLPACCGCCCCPDVVSGWM